MFSKDSYLLNTELYILLEWIDSFHLGFPVGGLSFVGFFLLLFFCVCFFFLSFIWEMQHKSNGQSLRFQFERLR